MRHNFRAIYSVFRYILATVFFLIALPWGFLYRSMSENCNNLRISRKRITNCNRSQHCKIRWLSLCHFDGERMGTNAGYTPDCWSSFHIACCDCSNMNEYQQWNRFFEESEKKNIAPTLAFLVLNEVFNTYFCLVERTIPYTLWKYKKD